MAGTTHLNDPPACAIRIQETAQLSSDGAKVLLHDFPCGRIDTGVPLDKKGYMRGYTCGYTCGYMRGYMRGYTCALRKPELPKIKIDGAVTCAL